MAGQVLGGSCPATATTELGAQAGLDTKNFFCITQWPEIPSAVTACVHVSQTLELVPEQLLENSEVD